MSETILPETKINKGQWAAFVHWPTKRVIGMTEFKGGGSAKTALTLVIKPTRAELLTEFSKAGYTYVEPKVN
jgi:hypothetical protein